MTSYKKGDVLVNKQFPGVERRIVMKTRKGYLWEYPYLPSGESNLFASVNSTDPHFVTWELKDKK